LFLSLPYFYRFLLLSYDFTYVQTQKLTFNPTNTLSNYFLIGWTIKVLKQTQKFHDKCGLSVEHFVDLFLLILLFSGHLTTW